MMQQEQEQEQEQDNQEQRDRHVHHDRQHQYRARTEHRHHRIPHCPSNPGEEDEEEEDENENGALPVTSAIVVDDDDDDDGGGKVGPFGREDVGRGTSSGSGVATAVAGAGTGTGTDAGGERYAPASTGNGTFGSALDAEILRRARRVGKRAALAGKKKIWDTNDASLHFAQSAVDAWESAYLTLRSAIISSAHVISSAYGATKSAAHNVENKLLLPVRDAVILPAFTGMERAASGMANFVQSDEAVALADNALEIAKRAPFVGESVLAPALCVGANAVKTAWVVARYPIPSRNAVRTTVDGTLTMAKLAIKNSTREIFFYMNIVDATITRTMLHTQWRILGSGPYSSLAPAHRSEVLNHICERYFALSDRHPISRYEYVAHIMAKNHALYDDLILSGLLWSRASDDVRTKDDDWLSPDPPPYWKREAPLLLLPPPRPSSRKPGEAAEQKSAKVVPLWFHLAYVNGKRPGKDVPWVRITNTKDRTRLEQAFGSYVQLCGNGGDAARTDDGMTLSGTDPDSNDVGDEISVHSHRPLRHNCSCPRCPCAPENLPPRNCRDRPDMEKHYPTLAKWYDPDLDKDVLIDEGRHAVSFVSCCGVCGGRFEPNSGPSISAQNVRAAKVLVCEECVFLGRRSSHCSSIFPSIQIIERPTLWRYHGEQGGEVRRGTWLLDTKRHGLQPYSDESAAVLEDAYMFLKYYCLSGSEEKRASITNIPLSVEVRGPDGEEQQLVQFQSLTNVTAIQKTLGGAVAVFKRRVYRGAASFERQDDVNARNESGQDEKANDECPSKNSLCNDNDCTSPLVSLAVSLDTLEDSGSASGDLDGGSDAEHLVLVVHGIGEMLRSVDVFGMGLPALCSIVKCCGFLRANHAAVHAAQLVDFKDINSRSSLTKEEMASAIVGRVEYLPVEWHESFALHTQRQVQSSSRTSGATATLNDISLKTIPALRNFANDTLLDVLYFMSPPHHDVIVDIVGREMHEVVCRYRAITGFNGKISILAHSLGSVISWDILSHQVAKPFERFGNTRRSHPSPASYFCPAQDTTFEDADPENSGPIFPRLRFNVDNFFMLGSPVAVFLLIRNQDQPLKENFSLPGCSRVFNIFHPYDPAAYRIEPLIDPKNSSIDAKIISHWKGGLRLKYQTKYFLKRIVDETRRTQKTFVEAMEAGIAGMGLLDNDSFEDDDDELSSTVSNEQGIETVVCGSLNQGKRVDFMLQEKEIENANEYVFALSAHSSYWNEKDLSSFLARRISKSTLDEDGGDCRLKS